MWRSFFAFALLRNLQDWTEQFSESTRVLVSIEAIHSQKRDLEPICSESLGGTGGKQVLLSRKIEAVPPVVRMFLSGKFVHTLKKKKKKKKTREPKFCNKTDNWEWNLWQIQWPTGQRGGGAPRGRASSMLMVGHALWVVSVFQVVWVEVPAEFCFVFILQSFLAEEKKCALKTNTQVWIGSQMSNQSQPILLFQRVSCFVLNNMAGGGDLDPWPSPDGRLKVVCVYDLVDDASHPVQRYVIFW